MDDKAISGLLQITNDAKVMDRNANLVLEAETGLNMFSFHTNSNPYVANYLDVLDRREKELQEKLDNIILKYAEKKDDGELSSVSVNIKKALLRGSMTTNIEKKYQEEIDRLEAENKELEDIIG